MECLEKLGAIKKVRNSDIPVVPVLKSDSIVSAFGDFKITVNLMLSIDQHPFPKAADLFAILAGGGLISLKHTNRCWYIR